VSDEVEYDDMVVCRFNFEATRLFRKAVRQVARKQGISEGMVAFLAMESYGPVKEKMQDIREGGRHDVG
jgi:hypothetical protein